MRVTTPFFTVCQNYFGKGVMFALSLLVFIWGQSFAIAQTSIAPPLSDDPVMEAKVMDIAKDLRCLVCQNETIAGSHADLAIDLRKQIKLQLEAGKSRSEIMQYMVDRYGDFVLYNPPMKISTIFLWLGPFLLMIIGLLSLRKLSKKTSTTNQPTNYSTGDLTKARALLEDKDLLKKDVE